MLLPPSALTTESTPASGVALCAVALGMQQQKRAAVARSLVPIAIGHALAIGSVVLACGVSRQGAVARSRPLSVGVRPESGLAAIA